MHRIALIVASLLSIFIAAPASAQVVITQAKALAGGVTPGDTAGYPVTLSQPGAYVLGSNLTVTPGTYGLFVTANNVDIDMKGFLLTGNGGGTYGLISGFAESRIHDGVINLFKNSGMYLRGDAWTIEDMKIVRNGGSGIDATNSRNVRVQHSLISSNVGDGALVGDDADIMHNIVSDNKLSGVICSGSCHVEGNKISKNVRTGIKLENGLVIGNTINQNGLNSQPIGIGYYGLQGSNPQLFKIGLINNSFVDNCPLLSTQTLFADKFGPNSCVGNPC